jgi:hypothetical protein
VSVPDRAEIAWVEGESVIVNTGHPAHVVAERRRLLVYHERLAIFFALCQEAPVDPDRKLNLLNQALTEWARSA